MWRTYMALSICALAALSWANVPRAHAADINALTASLQDPDPAVRINAFYALRDVGFTTSDQIKVAIINLLSAETAFVATPTGLSGDAGEAYRDYFGDLTRTVASFHDIRSITALVGEIDSGQTVTQALAGFGIASLSPVIAKASSLDPAVRQGVAMTLTEMIEQNAVTDSSSLAQIRNTLNTLATDSDAFVGLAAVEGLTAISGEPISGALQRVSIAIKPQNGGQSQPQIPTINVRSEGLLPVAILSTRSFDATTVDPATLLFGTNRTTVVNNLTTQDVNGDGLPDVVAHFSTEKSGITCSDTATFLVGKTLRGTLVVGSQAIAVVGCK